jgi:hypothetical protein
MTAVRTTLKILDPVIGRILAFELGFTSLPAQDFFVRGKSIHKAWEALQLMMEVLMDALRVTFFTVDGGANVDKCESDFVLWLEYDHDDEQFAFYSWISRVLLPALMCMAKGTRNKDLETYTSAHRLFLMLWFLFGNSSYGPDSVLDILTWFHRANPDIVNFYKKYCWSVDGQGAEAVVCEETICRLKENTGGRMTSNNFKMAAHTTENYKSLRKQNMKRAGMVERDLAQRTPVENEAFRKRMTARTLKEGMLTPVPGRRGVRPIDGKGIMREECTSWTKMFVLAEKRLEEFHTSKAKSPKFPQAIKYGLVNNDAVFADDEDSSRRTDSPIQFVAPDVAIAIAGGVYPPEGED